MPRLTGSLNIIGSLITTGSTTFSGSLNVLGPIVVTGSIRGNTATPVTTGSVLNGTASLYSIPPSTNTVSTASYGINVITSVSSHSYCIKLPAAVTGQSVSFVNKGGAPFYVFPSAIGGTINGIIDGWYQIPNDNNTYTLVCIQNPSPGVWQSTTPTPTGATLTSGIISASLGQSGSGYEYLAFVNDATVVSGSGLDSTSYNDFLNHPPVLLYTASNAIGAYVYPGQNVWQEITSIVVKTNISGGFNSNIGFKVRGTSRTEYYDEGTTTLVVGGGASLPYSGSSFDPDFAVNYPIMDQFSYNNLQLGGGGVLINRNSVAGATVGSVTKNIIPGTFVPSSASAYTSENIGDPGTVEYTLNLNAGIQPFLNKCIGSTKLFTFQRYDGNGYDVYYSTRWGLAMQNTNQYFSQNYPNLKLQVVYNVVY